MAASAWTPPLRPYSPADVRLSELRDQGKAMTTLENRPNTAVLVIDVQNGVVGDAYERDTVVANVGTVVEKARAAEVPVVWVQHSSARSPGCTSTVAYASATKSRDDIHEAFLAIGCSLICIKLLNQESLC